MAAVGLFIWRYCSFLQTDHGICYATVAVSALATGSKQDGGRDVRRRRVDAPQQFWEGEGGSILIAPTRETIKLIMGNDLN